MYVLLISKSIHHTMSSSKVSLLPLISGLLMSYILFASCTEYTVGNTNGWNLAQNYSEWASDKTFQLGDKLVFKYAATAHTVNEVTEADYNACSTESYLTTDNSGSTTITLNTTGTHYYICGIPGHCVGNMKLAVFVSSPLCNGAQCPPPPAMDANYSPPAFPFTTLTHNGMDGKTNFYELAFPAVVMLIISAVVG